MLSRHTAVLEMIPAKLEDSLRHLQSGSRHCESAANQTMLLSNSLRSFAADLRQHTCFDCYSALVPTRHTAAENWRRNLGPTRCCLRSTDSRQNWLYFVHLGDHHNLTFATRRCPAPRSHLNQRYATDCYPSPNSRQILVCVRRQTAA